MNLPIVSPVEGLPHLVEFTPFLFPWMNTASSTLKAAVQKESSMTKSLIIIIQR